MKLPHALVFTLLACLAMRLAGAAETGPSLSFGVISQRSAVLTAQYWNPILRHVSRHSGVPLHIKLAKSGPEHAAMIGRGEFDFIYSNHNFTPENDAVGYTVFARPIEAAIRGQIIVPADSPIQSLAQLQNRDVAFPSEVAFVGYHVPMDALLRAGITVKPQFAGNQAGALGRLLSGRVPAAAVNSEIARDFAARQNFAYRVLWSSQEYLGIPISAHPSVAKSRVQAVQAALLKMSDDPEGRAILAASAALLQQDPPHGFLPASDREFDSIRLVYKTSLANTPPR